MNSQKINGVPHYVFESDGEFIEFFENKPPPIAADWKKAKEGEWVRSDDGGIVQILKRGALKHHGDRPNYSWANGYVRTVVGTFVCHKNTKMDTNFALHPNRYTFSGTTPHITVVVRNRKNLTKHERTFAMNIASGMGLEKSYRDAYEYDGYRAREKAFLLMKQERVLAEINKSIVDIAGGIGVNHEYVLKGLKEIFEDGEDPQTALRSLIELGKAIGTLGNQPKKLQGGIAAISFSGFDQKHLDRIEDAGDAEVIEDTAGELPGKTESVEEVEE